MTGRFRNVHAKQTVRCSRDRFHFRRTGKPPCAFEESFILHRPFPGFQQDVLAPCAVPPAIVDGEIG